MTKKSDQRQQAFEQALRDHRRLTDLSKAAKTEADALRDEVILPTARDLAIKSRTFTTDDGLTVQVTIPTQGEKATVDEDQLKRRMGGAQWAKVTTPALDPVKLDAWLNEAGLTETEKLNRLTIVGQATVVKPGPKPSPRYKILDRPAPAQPEPVPAGMPNVVAIDIPDDI